MLNYDIKDRQITMKDALNEFRIITNDKFTNHDYI